MNFFVSALCNSPAGPSAMEINLRRSYEAPLQGVSRGFTLQTALTKYISNGQIEACFSIKLL
jgi:hypothetical protein